MTAWHWLTELHQVCRFQTREGKKTGKASTSELKRWLQNGAVVVNGEKLIWNEEMNFPINSVVLFPTSKNKVTLF